VLFSPPPTQEAAIGSGLTNRLNASLAILGWLLLSAAADRAAAIGWDSDDFIISRAPNFPQYIGIFDHDFTFKGYLDTNFLGVQGMDFDAQGNLVAVSSINPEVRVYDHNGNRIGGFKNVSGMMGATGDLKVLPDGKYILATANGAGGARVFSPDGQFLRQYGTERLRLWFSCLATGCGRALLTTPTQAA
jgi:hypothetical protein